MSNQKKILIITSIFAFLVGLFFSLDWGKPKYIDKKPTYSAKYGVSSRRDQGNRLPSVNKKNIRGTSYSSFVKRLQGSLTSEALGKLFEELLSDSGDDFDPKMDMLLQKWGEISPKQALEKIKNTKGSAYWLYPVFKGWAQKDPETAAHFYNESQDRNIKKNYLILSAISSKWVNHDPQKAWDWLQSQKGNYVSPQFQFSKSVMFDNLAITSPQKALQLFENLESADKEKLAYTLGEKCADLLSNSFEWQKKLPENALLKVEAGKIMALSKGEFKNIKTQLSHLEDDQRSKIMEELASPLLRVGSTDIQDRLGWIIESLPSPLSRFETRYAINAWFLEDPIDAKKWLDTLPTGEKKNSLLEIYKNRNVPTAIMN